MVIQAARAAVRDRRAGYQRVSRLELGRAGAHAQSSDGYSGCHRPGYVSVAGDSHQRAIGRWADQSAASEVDACPAVTPDARKSEALQRAQSLELARASTRLTRSSIGQAVQ